jgi:AcrR family transcriptional regulator
MAPPASARRYRGQSIDERRAERRVQLIEAAIGVYGEVGYRNASVKAVCEAAGLTERYFYESFAGSDDLLAAVYEVVVADLYAAMREAAAGAPDDPVRAALTVYYARLRENPNAARVFLVEIGGVSPKVDTQVRQALASAAPLFAPQLRPDMAAPELVAAGCVGAVIQIALDWIASGYARPLGEVVEAALSVCATARG